MYNRIEYADIKPWLRKGARVAVSSGEEGRWSTSLTLPYTSIECASFSCKCELLRDAEEVSRVRFDEGLSTPGYGTFSHVIPSLSLHFLSLTNCQNKGQSTTKKEGLWFLLISSSCFFSQIHEIMEECWDNDPCSRPSFKELALSIDLFRDSKEL